MYVDFAAFEVFDLVENKRTPLFDLPTSNKILKMCKANALIYLLKYVYQKYV